MIRHVHVCDRCGDTASGDGAPPQWYEGVGPCEVFCPPDGTNGKRWKIDLCVACRGIFNRWFDAFRNCEDECT